MEWTQHELTHKYSPAIWLAAAAAYDYVNGRYEALSGWKPFNELTPDEQQRWLQGQYNACGEMCKRMGIAFFEELFKRA